MARSRYGGFDAGQLAAGLGLAGALSGLDDREGEVVGVGGEARDGGEVMVKPPV